MDDLISRQAAIDALGDKPLAWTEGEYELGLQNQWQSDVDALKAAPSAQPMRKRGKWIPSVDRWGDIITTVDGYTCSECGSFNTDKDNFCPNCGADMRGEQDEAD